MDDDLGENHFNLLVRSNKSYRSRGGRHNAWCRAYLIRKGRNQRFGAHFTWQ